MYLAYVSQAHQTHAASHRVIHTDSHTPVYSLLLPGVLFFLSDRKAFKEIKVAVCYKEGRALDLYSFLIVQLDTDKYRALLSISVLTLE